MDGARGRRGFRGVADCILIGQSPSRPSKHVVKRRFLNTSLAYIVNCLTLPSKTRRKITLLKANISKTRHKMTLLEANMSKTRRKMTLLKANMSKARRKI